MNYAPTYYATDATASDKIDYNQAEAQQSFDLIPKDTTVRVRMIIKPGGYNDPARNWTGGFATRNATTGAIYLKCEFTILDAPYAPQKVWSLIGLHSSKGPEWNKMGAAFIKAIANSARGFAEQDQSPEAQAARNIGFSELNGIVFIAKMDVEEDKARGITRNIIKRAVLKGHKDYRDPAQPADFSNAVPVSDTLPPWAR
jgi:hypothetical protein